MKIVLEVIVKFSVVLVAVMETPGDDSYFLTRKAQESQKEMKLLLDMYRSAPKEQRDKVQLMAAEKKAKSEVRAWCTAHARGNSAPCSFSGFGITRRIYISEKKFCTIIVCLPQLSLTHFAEALGLVRLR